MQEAHARRITVYQDLNGKEPFTEWLLGLRDRIGQKSITVRINRLKAGLFGDCESVGEGVHELRLFIGPGYRVYFAELTPDDIIILWGGEKATQSRDIRIAQQFWKECQLHGN